MPLLVADVYSLKLDDVLRDDTASPGGLLDDMYGGGGAFPPDWDASGGWAGKLHTSRALPESVCPSRQCCMAPCRGRVKAQGRRLLRVAAEPSKGTACACTLRPCTLFFDETPHNKIHKGDLYC